MNINNNMNNMMQNENIGNEEEEEINDNQIDDNNININRIQQKEGDNMLNNLPLKSYYITFKYINNTRQSNFN